MPSMVSMRLMWCLRLQLMSRANSSPSRLRMTALTIPEHGLGSTSAMRAASSSMAVLPPIRKVGLLLHLLRLP